MAGIGLALAACGVPPGPAAAAGPAGAPRTVLPALAASQLPQYGNPVGRAWVPPAGLAVSTARPDHVIGAGTPAGCTSAAVVKTVALGGIITFDCGPKPVTIRMTHTAKIVAGDRIVIDGGGKVTLSGGRSIQILAMNTCANCWQQAGPHLIVQNMSFADGYARGRQTKASPDYGGGAIFDRGGQLTVVNSSFTGNRCYRYGPDLGGGAIRARGMDMSALVYLTHDSFLGNTCSNGGAVSGLYANFVVIDSLLTGNAAIGWGRNPAQRGTPGGGNGGAIYTDGDSYNLKIEGTAISGNSAREGGGGIFCVVNNAHGALAIQYSTLHDNLSGQFENAPGIFDSRNGRDVKPVVTGSAIS